MAMKSGQLSQISRITASAGVLLAAACLSDVAMGQAPVNDNNLAGDKRGYVPELVMQGTWRPVDQTVSDMSSNAASQRRLNHGNSQFSRNVTMYERDYVGGQLKQGLPTVDMHTGMVVPTQYQYRAPGVTALVQRPEYLVVVGKSSKRTYVEKNRKPMRDGLFADIGSAGMVYNLNIDLLNPVITAEEESSESPRAAYVSPQHYQSSWQPATTQVHSLPSVGSRLDLRVNGAYQVQQMKHDGSLSGSYYDPTVDGRFYNPATNTSRVEKD
ncbi:hypothetical protein JD969_08690 [Planctomycetota bacterium]|nr:hypothetical protein JD969_08690 [Planctomycetota bacterium]